MYPKPIQQLIDLFTELPGIGPRQAARFAFFLFKNKEISTELSRSLAYLHEATAMCFQCYRTVEKKNGGDSLCPLCADARRNPRQIAVVEKESDLINLEKTGAFHGLYHVLGGLVSPLDASSPKRIRLKELYLRIDKLLSSGNTAELILATSPTTEGDATALYIERIIQPLKEKYGGLTVSRLGRGLSLGTDVEYSDEATLKNALTNRK